MTESKSVSGHLVSRLKDVGVDHLFGIPGDYVLPFFDELVKPGGPIEHVGTCNELTATNLAEGYHHLLPEAFGGDKSLPGGRGAHRGRI